MVKFYGLAYKKRNREGKAIKKEKNIIESNRTLRTISGEVIGLGK